MDANEGVIKRKASLHGRMTAQESAAPNNSRAKAPQKIKDMVGNCPIQHDSRPNNFVIPQNRQMSINGCFGSSGMKDSLTGANRSQQKVIGSDKPNNRPIDDIRKAAYSNGVNRAYKPTGGTWLYTLK